MKQISHENNIEINAAAAGILLATISPIGFRSELGAVLGYLKIAGGKELVVERSELEFLDAEGKTIETRPDAYGLKKGLRLTGPYSGRFADDTPRNESASGVRWRVNDIAVKTSLVEPLGIEIRVVYLPLQVAMEKEPHIVFTLVNRGGEMMNIADGLRTAVCWVDGLPYRSNIGGHWDGSFQLRPDHSTTREFSLSNFPGIPKAGRHKMSLEILGIESEPQTIDWGIANSR